MVELSTVSAASIHGQVYPLQKPDYSRDVTDASHKTFVLVHLTSSLGTNMESRLLTDLWRETARKFGDIKFCEIRADLCIEGYPERNTPTILIYRDGDIRRQVITLRELGGQGTNMQGMRQNHRVLCIGYRLLLDVDTLTRPLFSTAVEKLLVDVGAVKANDHRVHHTQQSGGPQASRSANHADADDDDDWD